MIKKKKHPGNRASDRAGPCRRRGEGKGIPQRPGPGGLSRHGAARAFHRGQTEVVVFLQAEDGIRDYKVTGVQTCALPISVSVLTSYTSIHWPRRSHRATG